MSRNPYQCLPPTSFWSSGVAAVVSEQRRFAVDPLLQSLSPEHTIVSAGSCFSQYIGQELVSRNLDYLGSNLSDGRVESFGLGNVYSVIQFRQWLEFALGTRPWSQASVFVQGDRYFDYLLPHRDACGSAKALSDHRSLVAREMIEHLSAADLMIFTVGLTETWRNAADDVLPSCPGTLIGRFDATAHRFCNATFAEILADLEGVTALLAEINPRLRLVYTVSPVPLTATASADHVLVATSHSKSVIRAAVGEFCNASSRASYFPSFELVNHHAASDWRLEDNLRSVSLAGVQYVMQHAFDEAVAANDAPAEARRARRPSARDRSTPGDETVCEEGMLDAYARHRAEPGRESALFLIGDSHMQALANGFDSLGVPVVGGQVMNGAGFSDNRFELADEGVFVPQESPEAGEIWAGILERLRSSGGAGRIITNIGFQTHRTINDISNELNTPILDAPAIADHFDRRFSMQLEVLSRLTRLGELWMMEDPNYLPFLASRTAGEMVRDKNFHLYTDYMRAKCHELGIGYLAPCDRVMQRRFGEVNGFNDLVDPDRLHGSPLYYQYCARIVSESIGVSCP